LFAVTEMFPLVELDVALIEFVVEVPVQPEGNVQTYDVAPVTAATEYVLVEPVQIEVVPEMVTG
jgi:hypothetical protein